MRLLLLVVLNLFLILSLVNGTLSPNQGKKSKKQEKESKKFKAVDKDAFQRSIVKEKIKPQDILREANVYYKNTNLRHYVSGDILGYITPWNADGYENSRKFHGKFDVVSPIWLTINGQNPLIVPTHDIQRKWLEDMKTADNENHTTKIIPRVLFEDWSRDNINELYSDIQKRKKVIRILSDLAEELSFEGYVLEIWNQFVFSGVKKEIIISIISSIADELRKKDFDTILATPPLRGIGEQELFTKSDFDALAPHVKSFSLMTYDFSNIQRPGPNAPTEWIKHCIEHLVPDPKDIRRSQILMGINFYGYHYTLNGGGPIVGSQYLKFIQELNKTEEKILWDDRSQEHFFEVKSNLGQINSGGFVFYPTLYSLMVRLDLAAELKTGVSIWELGQGLTYFFDIL